MSTRQFAVIEHNGPVLALAHQLGRDAGATCSTPEIEAPAVGSLGLNRRFTPLSRLRAMTVQLSKWRA